MKIIAKDRLNAEDVRELTERLLREQLSLAVDGYKITTSMVLNVLLKAAVEKRSIEAVCADLTEVVDSNTLREALNQALRVEDLREHEVKFNAALAECIPSQMPRHGLEMVIDLHDEPFYGKSADLKAYTCRGEANDGTTYFWRIASLYVIWRQVRITLALTYVLPKESVLSVVQRLLARREALGFRFKVLYLDKGLRHEASSMIVRERGGRQKEPAAPSAVPYAVEKPADNVPATSSCHWNREETVVLPAQGG